MYHRNVIFATDQIYHIYNRTVGEENCFVSQYQLRKILEIVQFYLYEQEIRFSEYNKLSVEQQQVYSLHHSRYPVIEIYAFAIMPNHFHFLVKQLQDGGIKKFISIIQNSYAKYFNTRNSRHGSLFQSPFKAKWIESDEEFLHVSRYIHLNPVTSYTIEFASLSQYPWTSYPQYVNSSKKSFVNTSYLLGFFLSRSQYISFVEEQVDYQRVVGDMKRQEKKVRS